MWTWAAADERGPRRRPVTVDLDDVQGLRAYDPGDMLGAIASMPAHASLAYRRGLDATSLPALDDITAVSYCGMGGSAIAGDVLRALFRDRLGVPVDVNRSPELPEFAGPHTLVVVCSYSGGTAETLEAFGEAQRRGCRVIALTSGGELAERAATSGAGLTVVPSGYVPRAAFGYLVFGLLGTLEAGGLLPPLAADVTETVSELEGLVAALGPDRPREGNTAKHLAWNLGDRRPIVWGAEGIGAVAAARWKAQWNENAKVLSWWAALPELDHNEVVGWAPGEGNDSYVIALRHEGEHQDVALRFEPSLAIARDGGAVTEQVWAAGRSQLAQLCSLVVTGDYASVYLALMRGVDPSPMEAIDHLKAVLAEASS
jgi:glucose/mannose-6-phosphate isomerase